MNLPNLPLFGSVKADELRPLRKTVEGVGVPSGVELVAYVDRHLTRALAVRPYKPGTNRYLQHLSGDNEKDGCRRASTS